MTTTTAPLCKNCGKVTRPVRTDVGSTEKGHQRLTEWLCGCASFEDWVPADGRFAYSIEWLSGWIAPVSPPPERTTD